MPLFGKKPSKKPPRIYFATDVHGSERTFRKFINGGKFYGASVLTMGGDILGRLAIPNIREGRGGYRARLQGRWDFSDFPSHLWAQIITLAIIVVSALWYFIAKSGQKSRGMNVEYAFKEIPPE